MRSQAFRNIPIAVLASWAILIAVGCGAPSQPPATTSLTSGGQNAGSHGATQSLPQMSLSPASVTVTTGQTMAFSAPFGGVPLTWTVNGVPGGDAQDGTIDANGNYTAPVLPTSSPVSISAQLVIASKSNPLTAQSSVAIVNPAPQLTVVSPAAISAVTLPQLTITGSGFIPSSTVLVNGQPVQTTFVDATHVIAQVPPSATDPTPSVTVAVSNAAPGGGVTSSVSLPVLTTGTPQATTHPLVAKLSATLPAGASMFAEFGPDTTYGRKTWSQSAPSPGQPATLLVAGMRASSTYHMRLHFVLADSTELLGEDETFTTGDVPAARVPPITVTQNPSMAPSPGIEMMDFTSGTQQQLLASAVDLLGNLIWYYDFSKTSDGIPEGIKLLANGDIGVVLSNGFYREIDLTGQTIKEISVAQLNTQLAAAGSTIVLSQLHHDFTVLPNGVLVLLANTLQTFNNLAGLPGATTLLGDVLVALDPSGNIIWTWSTFDHLDPNRHPWVPLTQPVYDWTHCNTVVYSARDKSLLLSSRHQSWVMKIDFDDGKGAGDILWRLGPQGDFTLLGGTDPIDWFYNQHFPSFVTNDGPNFQLALFDNGDLRQLDSNGTLCGTTAPCYSRPVVMTIDETAKTATLDWSPHVDYSFFGGVSEELAPGRIEYTLSSDANTGGGRIVESTLDPIPTEVLRFDTTQQCYRATRIPSLYSGVSWPAEIQ